ncbi:MAG: acylneuraminate cytidylyltransferase family protein [Candidatus Methanoperedens sp.]|nr:acylneuraminate cytidylyltransferase family protein [Candidatus Methanoperedens sp.]CAG0969726.1 CMP-N,N'-diacetyllegionaminic acid synthase [Methanosarcinales archaeon]
MKNKIVALVPMRHDSKRVPGKNYRLFAGRPLYHHIVNSLSACPLIAKVVIDTDSPIIMKDATENFPQVQILERPEHIRADTIPMNEVLLHDVSQIKADFYLQTHSTNPLLKTGTITKAIESFLGKYPEYDSLFSVTRLHTRLWDPLVRPVNHNPAILLRTQDLPPIFEENSNIYIFTHNTLQTRRNRLGERPLMFEIDALESTDIDEELDFKIAELLYNEIRRK